MFNLHFYVWYQVKKHNRREEATDFNAFGEIVFHVCNSELIASNGMQRGFNVARY